MQIPTTSVSPISSANKHPFGYLKSFAEETPLHGFNIARRYSNKLDLVLWILLVSVCSVMTVQQTIQLIQLYQSEPTATSVTLRTREILLLDSIVLCVPFSNYIFGTTMNLTLTQMQNLLMNVNISDLQRINNESLYVPYLESELLSYLVEMFGKIADAEFAVATDDVSNSSFRWNSQENTSTAEIFSFLHSFIREQNISLEALLKVSLATVCERMEISVTRKSGTDNESDETGFDVCSPTNILFFDSQQFSVRLSTKEWPIALTSLSDLLIISFNLSAVFNRPLDKTLVSVPKYYLLFDGKAYQDAQLKSGGNLLSNNVESKICTSIRLRTAYKFYNSRRQPCSHTEFCFDCQNLCWAKLVAESCKCWPISAFPWKPENINMPTCTERISGNQTQNIPDFQNCYDLKLNKEILKCQRNCDNDCFNKEYDFTRETNATYIMCEEQFGINYAHDQSTTLLLFSNVFSYSYIEESLIKDWNTFLNEFGGLVGLWLGGSLIAFVHIPMYLLKTVYLHFNCPARKSDRCNQQCASE